MAGGSTPLAMAGLAATCVLTLWRALGGPDWLWIPIGIACTLLVAADRRRIPSNIRRMAGLLAGFSLLAVPFAHEPLAALSRGIFLGGLLISLVGAVTLIARCAYRSPQVLALGERLRSQPPRRRYFAFTMASQVFSAMLSLAGTNLLFIMASAAPDGEGNAASTVSAITRGFSSAIFWSPMFGNMAILLALYPSLSWSEVFPLGLLMAQMAVLVGVVLQRKGREASVKAQPGPPAEAEAKAVMAPLLVALGLFFAAVLISSQQLGMSITAAIVLCAVPVAWLFNGFMAQGAGRWRAGGRQLVQDLREFPSVVSEASLFMAAGCSGTILAAAFPQAWASAIGSLLAASPLAGISALMLALMALSIVGIHPVLTAVFLASTFTPELLVLPPVVHFCAILTGWGLAASLTPFSVLSMSASRYSGLGIYRVSIGENWRFASACTLLAAAVLSAATFALAGHVLR